MRLDRACLSLGLFYGMAFVAIAANAQIRISLRTPVLALPLSPLPCLIPHPALAPVRPPALPVAALTPAPARVFAAVSNPVKAEAAPEERAARAGEIFDQSAAIERLVGRIPDAVLFDWDDTLADEKPLVRATHEELFRRFGLPMPSHEELESQWRADHAVFYARFFPGVPSEAVEDAWHEITEQLRRGEEINGKRVGRAALFAGAVEALEALKKIKAPLAVVSNRREESLLREMEASGLRHYFKHVRGHGEGRERKPSSQSIDATLKALGIAPGNVWYIGDQISDMAAASGRGMYRILIGREQGDMARERGMEKDPAGAIVYLDALRELPAILRKLFNR